LPTTPTSPTKTSAHPAFEFEFLLNERSGQEWVLNREPRIAVPLDRCIRRSDWALPTAAPEVVLFYKGGGNLTGAEGDTLRPGDEQDFHALLPTLTDAQRSCLRESLAKVRREHPWLAHLAP
jgi:hypothetical protein